tara:strand:+ start:133 stop:1773 length:1641 start_codon:yes stop_codon:yes gene_type:complete
MQKIIECVPNFSEGRSKEIIDQITNEIKSVDNVELLDVDMGYDTNRTVVTFAGEPNAVSSAAFKAIKKASMLIDMKKHSGAHPRMGAVDVCPIIPVKNISIKECIEISKELSEKVAKTLKIPIYLYEYSASDEIRKNLANIRSGEYEGLRSKLKDKKWLPDYGPTQFNAKSGATAIGVRDFLIAFNVNLNTSDKRIASDIALDIREKGRAKRDSNNKIIRDKNGKMVKVPGTLKSVKAVGWYIDEYKQAQVSMNLTNYKITSIHKAFEEVRNQANKRGVRVTGSEIVGLVPKESILSSGEYFLKKQNGSISIPEQDIIKNAIQSLGLNDLTKFSSKKSIIEEALGKKQETFSNFKLNNFIDEVSRKSPTPGGGSISALAGSISSSLSMMALNLSYSKQMEKDGVFLRQMKDDLLHLIDEDAKAFDQVMKAYSLPKKTDVDKKIRYKAIEKAYMDAVSTPMLILKKSSGVLYTISKIYKNINPNCISDLGVAIELASASVNGAIMNIRINLCEIKSKSYKKKINKEIEDICSANDNILFELNKNISI